MSTPGNQLGPVVVVGGGLAGQRCTETLRRRGYDGPIRIICAESDPPYDRPPLSKDVLGDASRESSLPYRPAAWYEEHDVDLLLGVRAERLRPAEHRVDLSDGSSLPYAQLLIATGSAPRDLPAVARGENVSVLRTLPDSRALREALADGPHLAVVGAGFIGQEVAASARRLDLEVTMIEAAPQPLMGVLGPELGAWFARLHRDEGVRVLTDSSVQGTDRNGRLRALHLAGGERIEVDHVLVAVGVVAVRAVAGRNRPGRRHRRPGRSMRPDRMRARVRRRGRGRDASPGQRPARARGALGERRAPGRGGGHGHARRFTGPGAALELLE